MPVKLVIFDCDGTLWDHRNVSELVLPFRRIDEGTVEDAQRIRVRLSPGVHTLLAELRRRGTVISLASWNRPEQVFAILDEFRLTPFFTRPKVEFHPYKEKTIAALLSEFAAEGLILRPEEVLFVDDSRVHLRRVQRFVGPVRTLRPDRNLVDMDEVLRCLEDEVDTLP